jgi:hypothetical protein
VAFSDGSYLGLSSYPNHPQGFSQYGEGIDPQVMAEWIETGEAIDLAVGDLPPEILSHILCRENEGFEDFLISVEKKDPKYVAPSRGLAEENDGTPKSLGVGIYHTEEGYRIRTENGEDQDRGPFATAREVILASLPDHYSLAGPEYHSTISNLLRKEPEKDIIKAVEALEKSLFPEHTSSTSP